MATFFAVAGEDFLNVRFQRLSLAAIATPHDADHSNYDADFREHIPTIV